MDSLVQDANFCLIVIVLLKLSLNETVLSKYSTFKFSCKDALFSETDLEVSYCSNATLHCTYFSLPFPHAQMFWQHTFSTCKTLPEEHGRFPMGSHPALDELVPSQRPLTPLPLPPLDLPALPTPLCLVQHPRPPPHISENPWCDIYIEIFFSPQTASKD